MAFHLREKGVWIFPMLQSPISVEVRTNQRYLKPTGKHLNGNLPSVKLIISIMERDIIEKIDCRFCSIDASQEFLFLLPC
jgi:hypothetical protein